MRRLLMLSLAMLCMILQPIAAGGAAAPADAAGAALQQLPWNATYADWRRQNPGAACREFTTVITLMRADDEYCYRCTRQDGGVGLEWAFYAFGPADRPACRLQQFRARIAGPEGSLREVHQQLRERLDGRYGTGSNPGPLYERGAAYWLDTLRWRPASHDVYLYRNTGRLEPTHTGLLARERALTGVIARDEARMYDWDWIGVVPPRWDQPLGAALGDQFPELPALLARVRALEATGVDWPRDLDDIRAALRRLIEAAAAASGNRRAALLLGAERLAQGWNIVTEYPGWDRERAELGALGLGFSYSELGAAWGYDHDLLWRVWREHGDTEWGEHAFVFLLHRGWSTRVGCGTGAAMFRDVIREGEAFLTRRERSPRRLDVVFALGQAYETWWALSKTEEDVYANPADYREGAEAAREKAIRHYEAVVRGAPDSPEAEFARRQLPRLKLRIGTAQFRFYCIYD